MFQVQRRNITDASHKFTSSLNKDGLLSKLHERCYRLRIYICCFIESTFISYKSSTPTSRIFCGRDEQYWTFADIHICRHFLTHFGWLPTLLQLYSHIFPRNSTHYYKKMHSMIFFFFTNTDNDLLLLADTDEFTILYLKKKRANNLYFTWRVNASHTKNLVIEDGWFTVP